jgi:outer membrane murein-binding lipoprotein Lpp
MRIALVAGLLTALCFVVAGCVSPETATKLDSLTQRVNTIAAEHAEGKLTTKEAVAQIKPLLAEMKAVRDAEGKWYHKIGYILLSIGGVVAGRLLGIPGLRSGSAPNLASLLVKKDAG